MGTVASKGEAGNGLIKVVINVALNSSIYPSANFLFNVHYAHLLCSGDTAVSKISLQPSSWN